MQSPRQSGVLVLASVALLGLDWPGQGAARAAEFAHATTTRRIELLYLLAPSQEPEARAALASGLSDTDISVRETARLLAAQHPSEELVPALLRLLEDPDPAARTDALDALARTHSPEARRAIERALSDRITAVRAHAVLALSDAGADAVVALLDRVHDPEGDVRVAAANALGHIGDPRAVLGLVGISQDPIPEVRLAATQALGSLGGEVAARTLLGLAHDAMPDVRLAALRGLQQHPSQATIPTLTALARPNLATSLTGRDELARAAIAALGQIDSPEARSALLDLALDPRATRARDAIDALLAHPDRLRAEFVTILPRVTRDNIQELAEMLGRIGGEEVVAALIDLLGRVGGDGSAGATPSMLRALGRTGSDRALRALLERLNTPPPSTPLLVTGCARGAVHPALLDALSLWSDARHGLDPLALDPLAETLQQLDLSCHTQLSALIRLLGLTGNDRAAPTLIATLQHPDAVIRAMSAQALGRVASPTGLAPLMAALSDSDASVRAAAATSLRAMSPDALLPALTARWRDPAPVDRSALLLTLGHALASTELPSSSREANLPVLFAAAASGPWYTRASALRALGAVAATRDPAALRALTMYATVTSDVHLAGVAMEALGNLPFATPATQSSIAAQLDPARTPAARSAAAWALRSAGPGSVELFQSVLSEAPSAITHNALASLARTDFSATDAATRTSLRTGVQRLLDGYLSPSSRTNACVALDRLGGSCPGVALASTTPLEPHSTDIRVLDEFRHAVVRPVLLRLPDGVTVWITPDIDGWIRVCDGVVGSIQVLDRTADEDR